MAFLFSLTCYIGGIDECARLQRLIEWYSDGGILLIGYELFRMLVSGDGRDNSYQRYLLQPGPDLIVVDEGHRISNAQSGISTCLKQVKTTKRIALTGYPLQNNLVEYWCMVDFVRPNYLGTVAEFRNTFQNPINNGLCADSNPSDVKLAKRRMYVLSNLLKPFVKRRDVSYLQDSLPPKHEFVVSLSLSPLQIKLYKAFLQYRDKFLGTDSGGAEVLAGHALLLKIW